MRLADPPRPLVTRSGDHERQPQPWGELLWGVSEEIGNTEALTVGWCLIEEGQVNGRHYHPNCEEVLVVVEGRIRHSWNDEQVEMDVGDLIAIPPGVVHSAENIGEGRARLLICFSAADRQTVGVED